MKDDYDIEYWEQDSSLYEKEDWKGLLKLRKEFVIKHPNDLNNQERYIEALILNKKYNEAINCVTPLYDKYYEKGFGVGQIVEALAGLGKTENDFNWKIKPKILKLNKDILEICIQQLKTKKEPVTINELYCDIIIDSDYTMFEEDSFFYFLKTNKDLFDFTGDIEFCLGTKIKLR
ncbi:MULTISPECIES: hypothetical protein [unclassified Carboxylicivirga]|uniref:hypothetical protein n=1 Tax=Carboxylicivirga TaxID=1628153 RepID=UPI003D3330E6